MLAFFSLVTALALPALAAPVLEVGPRASTYSPIRIRLAESLELCLGNSHKWIGGNTLTLESCGSDTSRILTHNGDDMFAFGVPGNDPTCIDVTKGNVNNPLQGWWCTPGNPNQKFGVFTYYKDTAIKLVWSGTRMCLHPKDGVMAHGTPIVLVDCNDAVKWEWNDDFTYES